MSAKCKMTFKGVLLRPLFIACLVAISSLSYASKAETVVVKEPQGNLQKETDSQPFELKGRVLDAAGEPLMGAVLMVKGTQNGTSADMDGAYVLKNVNVGQTIIINYVGKETIEQVVTSDNQTMNFTLRDKDHVLSEVVVTGYQTISRERAVGSFDVVSGKDLEGKMQSNILERLEGLVSGVNNFGTTNDDGEALLTIRGVSTYMANKKPLYVVDGMPYEGDLGLINPDNIINVSVLKDATANSIYGAQAANGVIVITTKQGKSGKVSVAYSGNVKFIPKPDFGYLNLINSTELIDLQVDGFNYRHNSQDDRLGYNPITSLMYRHEAGELNDSQLETELGVYRQLNNRKQIEKEFERVGIVHQHNLSVSGGNDKNTYLLSLNYYGDTPNQVKQKNSRIGFNFRDNIKFTNWLRGDFSVNGNYSNTKNATGASTFEDLVIGYPSYVMLRDKEGNVQNFPSRRSAKEQERLIKLGLNDESYSPITNLRENEYKRRHTYYRVQAGLNADIIEGLSADLKFQLETGDEEEKTHYEKTSYYVRTMVNDAALFSRNTLKLNVPRGGQLDRRISNHYSYTLRGQLNYSNLFKNKHSVAALLGAERRLVRDQYNRDYYMGYDDSALEVAVVNLQSLQGIYGTEAPDEYFSWNHSMHEGMASVENRYVSFYANASYEYDRRYSFTGSIRIDQSNLFGTDPKYQYRPLWSVGLGWHIKNESFMQELTWLDKLSVRLTHGIGGNVAKDAGPYLQLESIGQDIYTKEMAMVVMNPANEQLRWEKTATTNVGLDMSFLQSKIRFTFDFYNKSTSDLLGNEKVNSISGWKRIMYNYGSMYNRGVELGLNTSLGDKNFNWDLGLNFSYNKNKLTNLNGTTETVFGYTNGGVTAQGYPLNSLFSYKYAGISDTGKALVYDKEGEKVENVDDLDALVYSGTRDPKYVASMINSFKVHDFQLSFTFVYYGGHVLRDISAPILSSTPGRNLHNSILNRWKQAGDEQRENVTPGYQNLSREEYALPWISSDRHVKKADYIKLRDISLSYKLPRKILRTLQIESATLTCQVNNVWWWAKNGKIDPEAYRLTSMYGYEPVLTLRTPTTCTLGVAINF